MTLPALRARFASFRCAHTGLAALEFALAAPILAMLLLGGYDLTRYIIIRGGVDKVGFSVADVTSQYRELTSVQLKKVFLTTGQSLKSYTSGSTGVTVLTSVYLSATNVPTVRWQCYSSASSWKSKVGATGATATINSGLLADVNDNIVIAEVYYNHKPVFNTFFKNGFDIYTQSLFRPRLGDLTASPC